jgi:hypothetical protein
MLPMLSVPLTKKTQKLLYADWKTESKVKFLPMTILFKTIPSYWFYLTYILILMKLNENAG